MSPDDRRLPILNLLADYKEQYPLESETVEQYRQFVLNHPDCFERSLLSGHVTGSALVLDSSRKRILLTHHRKLNRWLQPGGHADGDADVMQVAMRETREETGLALIRPLTGALLDVDIHSIPARPGEPKHFHYDCRFLLGSEASDNFTVSEESNDLAWVSMGDIGAYTTEQSIIRMLEKARRFIP